ncbi:MAG: F0F1 ATP synthase subunit delta [Metamycoplasmataceae bacterium]
MSRNENLIGYSLALFSIAKDENKVKEYLRDAKILYESFLTFDYHMFFNILSSKKISQAKKEKIIDTTFKKLDKYFLNFLKLLVLKNKFHLIKNIINLFINHCYDYLNIKEGIVYSSWPLSVLNLKEIEKKLSSQFNCKVSLKNLIDKELISGIKIIFDNTIIENSVISDLQQISKILRGERRWE